MDADYKKLQSKYKLPSLVELKKEFPVKIESKETLLADILDSMFNKLTNISESFEGIMTGEGFSSMFEAGMLDLKEKEEVFRLYRNMKSLLWEARLAISRSNEKEMATVVKKTYASWSEYADRVAEICKKLSDGWKNIDVSKISDTLYHG